MQLLILLVFTDFLLRKFWELKTEKAVTTAAAGGLSRPVAFTFQNNDLKHVAVVREACMIR